MDIILSHVTEEPLVASFPGIFLAAASGNNDALWRVITTVYAIHHAAKSRWAELPLKEKRVSNAIVQLSNMLVERIEAEDEAAEESAKSQSAPVGN